MKPLPLLIFLAAAPFAAATGKPPSRAKTDARPSPPPPVTPNEAPASLLRWLWLQNGSPSAAAIPWPEIVRAASGRQTIPLDPANASDAALVARLGAALDVVLPKLNQPDGPLRGAPKLTAAEFTARIADGLRGALAALPGNTAENLPAPNDAACPLVRWNGGPDGRTCYLAVAVYPTGGRSGTLRALTVRAADLAGQITTDGTCLLVGIEHNGKAGREVALLNWEAIDLSRLSLRCALTFEADSDGLHAPGATVADGRRGRD